MTDSFVRQVQTAAIDLVKNSDKYPRLKNLIEKGRGYDPHNH